VLGIVPEPHFEQCRETLAPGDVVLFYTDGVTEAMNSQHELFGEDRLEAVLRQHHHRSAHEIIQAVLEAVGAFVEGESQSDDITMVVVRCRPDDRPRRER
jgi:sigma-B regulation protein RsbU (phosphoserine phosphatase)